ncbi:MAG: complex I NDUFA9 subunit family protein [Nitrospinota bacterium]
MKIFVAGGTGFVGSYIVRELLKKGHSVKCLTRRNIELHEGATQVIGDALAPYMLPGNMFSFDAVINLIGIIREFPTRGITFGRLHTEATRNLVDAAKAVGIKRFIQMSANGVNDGSTSATGYQRTKYEGEEIVKTSGLDWTIFRPSLIFGKPPEGRTEFCTEIAGVIRNAPFIPVFDGGEYRMQPVHVKDVAAAFAGSLEKPESIGKTLHLGGADTFSYKELLDIICAAMGKKPKGKVNIPWVLARPLFSILGKFPFFPATAEQIDMLIEGNTVPETDYRKIFNIEPEKFSAEILGYL